MLFIVGVFLAMSLTVIAMARPLIQRRVPPNRIYGLKMKATFADERVWYEANEASGRDMLKWGVAQLAAVFVPLAILRPASWSAENLDEAGTTYLGINLGVMVVGLTIALIIGYVRANRLLRERIATGVTLKPKPPGR